ncbi:MAG: polyphenol oxidase family protein [Candidatus Peribacteraceae bacterium]
MISTPFPLLRQFSSVLDIRLLTKEDNVSTDESIGIAAAATRLCSLWQAHGGNVEEVTEPSSRELQADALITNIVDLSLSIRAADCQQILLFDPVHNAIGLVHAGWKGLQSGVITNTVKHMNKVYGTDPRTIFAAAGPSLCTSCAEFSDPAREVPELIDFLDGRSIDLRKAADHELVSLGVPASHIDRTPDCTRCNPEQYWTYRGGDQESVMNGMCNVMVATLRVCSI